MDSEHELRRSGRSTRRASFSEYADGAPERDMEIFDTEGLATPPPTNSPKKQRRSSIDATSSSSKLPTDESKHSFKFEMSKEAFIKDLYTFMQARGQPISKLPSLGYQELDLYLLYQLVIARGGMDEVTRKQEWKLVYQDLGIPTMSTSASYNTRTNYKKYLYLYELEHCDFPDKNRPKDVKPNYQIGEFIRIVSSVFEGQVFFARILKYRFREGKNQYYVHYNGWNSSHDEWMREDVLDPLLEDERSAPELLANPPPSRSSKSNHLIYDPTVSEKVINNLVSTLKPSNSMQNPLSPASPAAYKKSKKNVELSSFYGVSSEEEEAASELISGMERYAATSSAVNNTRTPYEKATAVVHRQPPVEVLRYPMRSDPGDDIAKIMEEKRDRPHERDLIHRNRLHTHVLMGNEYDESERERQLVADLLKSVKVKLESGGNGMKDVPVDPNDVDIKPPTRLSNKSNLSDAINDPRSLHDIQESLVGLQASLLATQTSYKHAMKALKKHHNVQSLPPLPKKNVIGTRRSNDRI